MIRISGATTIAWLTICRIEPSAPSGRRAKMPTVMKPSWATEEKPAISRTSSWVKAITEP